MLVLDANVVLPACTNPNGFVRYGAHELFAPPLMWSEARANLHLAMARGVVSREVAERSLARLHASPVSVRAPRRLGDEAWRIADELGVGRTYDAEYLALARLLGCPLVTLDLRLRRGAARIGSVIGPDEL